MIDADRIRQAARDVLGRPEYADLQETLPEQWFGWLRARAAEVLDALLGSAAASGIGQLVAFGLVALLVVGAVVVLLGLRRDRDVDALVDVDSREDAVTVLARAERARAAGDHERAIRDRYGALVLVLAEAGVLVVRPGLTVGEVDAAVAAGAPTATDEVTAAGDVLADVVYGDRTADTTGDDRVARGLAAVARATGRGDIERAVGPSPAAAGDRP